MEETDAYEQMKYIIIMQKTKFILYLTKTDALRKMKCVFRQSFFHYSDCSQFNPVFILSLHIHMIIGMYTNNLGL